MSWVNIIIVIIFCSQVSAKEAQIKRPDTWDRKTSLDGSTALKKHDKLNTTFVIKKYNLRKPIVWNADKIKKKIGRIENIRSRLLALAGIKNWKISKHQIQKKSIKGDSLVLEGQYIGSDGQTVQFYEYNYYVGKEHFQMTYSQDNTKKLNLKEAKNLIKQVEFKE